MTSASTFSEHAAGGGQPDLDDRDTPEVMDDLKQGGALDEPTLSGDALLHGQEPSVAQLRLYVSQAALQQLDAHCTSDLSMELGGVLLGHAGSESQGSEVRVLAALPVATDSQGPVHFTFTADTWAQLHRDRASTYPELDIVGWYHTHPNLGVFYSADDVIVHSAAFVMPWQVGLVIDPVRSEGCIVGWQEGVLGQEQAGLAGIDGFFELLDEQPDSLLRWRLIPSNVWQSDGYYQPSRTVDGNQVYAPDSEWPALPPISPWWGVLLGGMSLLISLLLLIERLLGG